MIIGMAGHIDHGKSALASALTGKSMDRLADEQRRGITIELNFAPLDLGEGREASLIDVPGHEDFVRTMAAGASGVDLMLLVVAADEGLMPQTREHLAIGEQLAVPRGIPVITKVDLVSPDWLELVTEELTEVLSDSPIDWSLPVAVSSQEGTGIDELKSLLMAQWAQLRPRPTSGPFRLPVDRAFSVAGAGTVVTGTCWSGVVEAGHKVRILPADVITRVRAVEVHGHPTTRAGAGNRVALALTGIDRSQVPRGSTVVDPDSAWRPVTALDVCLSLLPQCPRPLEHRTRLRVLHGTSEVMARVNLRAGSLDPGRSGMARLALERPLAAMGQDRLVIRSYSPVATLGGGQVLDPQPPVRRGRRHGGSYWPQDLASAVPARRLAALVDRRPDGLPVAEVPVLLGQPDLPQAPGAGYFEVAGRLVTDRWVEGLRSRANSAIAEYHEKYPSHFGLPLETLRKLLDAPGWLAEYVVSSLIEDGEVAVVEGRVSRPDFSPTVSGGAAAIDAVVAAVEDAGFTPPTVSQLAELTGHDDIVAILRLAAAAGRVEAVTSDRYYGVLALRRFVERLRYLGREGPVSVADLRGELGLSRKYLIPLLEWSDRQGVTVRSGDARQLAG